MTEEKSHLEGSALFEETLVELRQRMAEELGRLDSDEELQLATSEKRLKYLSGYFKTLQGVEDMVNRLWDKRGEEESKGISVVEFRRQLEEQIERLIQAEAAQSISGGAK